MTVGEELPSWLDTHGSAPEVIAAVEDMLSPIRQLLDRFDDHLDPRLAPQPVLDWLAACFGVDTGRHQRAVLTALADIHNGWATCRGLTALVTAFTSEVDATIEVIDNGATAWSTTPGAITPGNDSFTLVVHITTTTPEAIDLRRLDGVLATAVPAHMRYRIDVTAP